MTLGSAIALKRVAFLELFFISFQRLPCPGWGEVDMRSPTMYVLGFGWVIFGLVMLTLWMS